MVSQAMTDGSEVVGLFAERESFERAVAGLLSSGFERADLSVLASHESLEAAGRPPQVLARGDAGVPSSSP